MSKIQVELSSTLTGSQNASHYKINYTAESWVKKG